MKVVDLTQPWGMATPPWPGGSSPIIRYVNRISTDGYSQQELTYTTHIGTHLDGPMHFDSAGRDLASLPMDKLFGDGVIVDISEVGPYGIYGPKTSRAKSKSKKATCSSSTPVSTSTGTQEKNPTKSPTSQNTQDHTPNFAIGAST